MAALPDDAFRKLVQQLMNAEWYLVGQEKRPIGMYWRFRQGHTLETSGRNERWIAAPNEMAAMRILWNELHNERVTGESYADRDSG